MSHGIKEIKERNDKKLEGLIQGAHDAIANAEQTPAGRLKAFLLYEGELLIQMSDNPNLTLDYVTLGFKALDKELASVKNWIEKGV